MTTTQVIGITVIIASAAVTGAILDRLWILRRIRIVLNQVRLLNAAGHSTRAIGALEAVGIVMGLKDHDLLDVGRAARNAAFTQRGESSMKDARIP